MAEVSVRFVDVYIFRPSLSSPPSPSSPPEVLCLRRAAGTRCAGTWETVHGHILDGERAVAAALRELAEETGLVPERLYSLSRLDSFYLHREDVVALIPVFCAWVASGTAVTLSAEHDAAEWLSPADAALRFAWPREARALEDALRLLGNGDAGGLEDVLRADV